MKNNKYEEALDTTLNSLLQNDKDIKAGKDPKVISLVISNANAVSNVVDTVIKLRKTEESNKNAILKVQGGK